MTKVENGIELIVLNGATRRTFTTVQTEQANTSVTVCQQLKIQFLGNEYVRIEAIEERADGLVRTVFYDNGTCHIRYASEKVTDDSVDEKGII